MFRPRSGWRIRLVLLAWATAACSGGSGSTTAPSGSATVRLQLSQVPPTVTEIRLRVTGDGMPPVERRIALDDVTTFLELSPGRRTFEVTVRAKGKTFSGSTTQEIRNGLDNLVEVRVRLNEAPAVRITADRTAAFPGSAIHLACTASDPDGDPVAISWAASGGSLSATAGPTTSWSSPGGDRYTITCTATDPTGAATSASLEVSTVTYTLTVSIVGSVTALVTSSPGGITCGLPGPGDCSQTYLAGTTITLTATTPFTFNGWTGAGCSGTGTCVVKMNGNRSVSASFS